MGLRAYLLAVHPDKPEPSISLTSTVEAAEAVCRPEPGPAIDVLETVGGLIDKSLLRQVESVDGELRLEMLETIREFGQELMAVAAAERGQFERAARLFGADQALRDATGSTMNVRWREVRERGLASARSALGEGPFAVIWAEGHAMTREQAIAYALEETAPA
jgi:hypothetical protein